MYILFGREKETTIADFLWMPNTTNFCCKQHYAVSISTNIKYNMNQNDVKQRSLCILIY